MNKKKLLSVAVVILLCLVLAWEISVIVNREIEKQLSHDYPVMDIITAGLCNVTVETKTDSGITTDFIQGGLQSPLFHLTDLPLEATTKSFDEEDWLYRYTFNYFYTDPSDNSVVSYDVICLVGPENMQIDGVTYQLPGDNWDLLLPLFETYLELSRTAEFNDFE